MRFRDQKLPKAAQRSVRKGKNRCHWCKRNMRKSRGRFDDLTRTKDHYWPRSLGGTETVPCCNACNQLKKAMTPSTWHQFMAENPRWWDRQPDRGL